MHTGHKIVHNMVHHDKCACNRKVSKKDLRERAENAREWLRDNGGWEE